MNNIINIKYFTFFNNKIRYINIKYQLNYFTFFNNKIRYINIKYQLNKYYIII